MIRGIRISGCVAYDVWRIAYRYFQNEVGIREFFLVVLCCSYIPSQRNCTMGPSTSTTSTNNNNNTNRKSRLMLRFNVHPLYIMLSATILVAVQMVLVHPPHQRRNPPDSAAPHFSIPTTVTIPRNFISSSSTTSSLDGPSRPRRPPPPREPDGYLNGYPIHYHNLEQEEQEEMWSQMHCIGESFGEPFHWHRKKTYLDLNWMTRSCRFQFLCVDTLQNDFVVFFPPPPFQYSHPPSSSSQHLPYVSSTVFTNSSSHESVSIGGINAKWGHEGIPRLQWFPRVLYQPIPTQFYTLPSHVTLIPFHSLAAYNPGHLVWDDFLPIFTLMQIFLGQSATRKTKTTPKAELLLIRYVLPATLGHLWAGCDWRDDRNQDCRFMLKKFGPLMVVPRDPTASSSSATAAINNNSSTSTLPISTQHSLRIEFTNEKNKNQSNYICARNTLTGMGSLTDHGTTKLHGWEPSDYKSVYNAGRGGQLWKFRNFMLSNLGLIPDDENDHDEKEEGNSDNNAIMMINEPPRVPYVILFSENSSKNPSRNIRFDPYVQALKESTLFVNNNNDDEIIQVRQVQMHNYSLKEQASMVQHAAIYVTANGGGAVSATFLPRGSSVMLFYNEKGGISRNKGTGLPARLDWDYFNNMAYTRVHWLTKPTELDELTVNDDNIQLFVELVKHEVDVMTILRQQWEANRRRRR